MSNLQNLIDWKQKQLIVLKCMATELDKAKVSGNLVARVEIRNDIVAALVSIDETREAIQSCQGEEAGTATIKTLLDEIKEAQREMSQPQILEEN
jgi:hypothetical protein